MKNKLRKITVDDLAYLYRVTNKYNLGSQTNTMTVRIFLAGQKQTPLVIEFLTIDDCIMGQPLKSGVDLTNKGSNISERVNINEPRYIRELILQGWKKGWTGKNKMEIQNGLEYLSELGYDTESVKPVDS